MLRSICLSTLALLCMAFSAAAQTTDPNTPPASKPQDSTAPTEAKKPKKVVTNEDLSNSTGKISVVGNGKDNPGNKPRTAAPNTATPQYVESVRNQLEKLLKQIADLDKQIADLKNFSSGEPSTTASGVDLDKRLEREPIEVRIRALQDKKKDLRSKVDSLYDEARKKGVESGQLP